MAIHLKCNKCGYEWNYKGSNYRTNCFSCKKKGVVTIIKTGLPYNKNKRSSKKSSYIERSSKKSSFDIENSIMTGKMLEMLKTVKPKNIGDAIPFIIQNPELEVRLVDACRKIKRKPEKIIQMALKEWLDKKEIEWKKE